MLRTRNFHTLLELCDFVKTNNIDVYSEDVKYLGEYIESLSPRQDFTCKAYVYSEDVKYLGEYIESLSPRQDFTCKAYVYYAANSLRIPLYTIQYEDHGANVGLLDSHYVEDFSEN